MEEMSPRWGFLIFAIIASGCYVDGENEPKLSRQTYPVHNVCSGPNSVQGIDVSFYQSEVNWAAVKSAGKVFAFIRVSDGIDNPDSQFDRNWKVSQSYGIIRGAYQYFRASKDPISQAELMLEKISAAGGLLDEDLPPVIDVETMSGQSRQTVLDKVATWIKHVEEKTHRTPIIYTGAYFWDDNKLGSTFNAYPLWAANYVNGDCPLVSDSWSYWHFWQYSDKGKVSGISSGMDVNRFNGTLEELKAFVAASSTAGGDGGKNTSDGGIDHPGPNAGVDGLVFQRSDAGSPQYTDGGVMVQDPAVKGARTAYGGCSLYDLQSSPVYPAWLFLFIPMFWLGLRQLFLGLRRGALSPLIQHIGQQSKHRHLGGGD